MKSRRSGAGSATTPRSSNLTTMRSVVEMTSDYSCEILLEQLKYFVERPSDNLDVIVTICSKLFLKLTSQDKTSKDKVLEKIRRGKRDFYPLFLKIIEIAPNLRSITSVIGLLYESLNSKNVAHKNLNLKLMTDLDATTILGRAVIHHDVNYLSEYMIQLVWILGQMSWRDSRFRLKMRKFSKNGVKAFHNLLKLRASHLSTIFVPTLRCLKTLSKSAFLANVLVRDGIAATLETILTNIGTAISIKLRLVLAIALNLTKNTNFIKKITKLGVVSHLLLIFDRWLKFNTIKKYKASHLVLCILHKIVIVSKASRSLISSDILHRFCLSLPDEQQHYPMISKAFCIINICSNKTLPLTNTASPVTFELPITDITPLNSEDENDSDDEDEDEMDVDVDLAEEDLIADDDNYDTDCDEAEPNEADFTLANKQRKELLSQQQSSEDVECSLLMYYDHFREFGNLIPNTKENLSPPLTRRGMQNSDVIRKSCDATPNSRRTLRSLPLTNHGAAVSGDPSTPRLTNDIQKTSVTLRVLQGIKPVTKIDKVYQLIANRINSVVPFVKIAYPDLCLISSSEKCPAFAEPLHVENRKNIKNKMLTIVDRLQHPDALVNSVVYDFDDLYYWSSQSTTPADLSSPDKDRPDRLSNHDVTRLGVREHGNSKSLHFESRFECGNLRKASQVAPYEYDLLLMPDVNSSRHHQWFYFEVSNMDSQATYTLNIINKEKHHSQSLQGMKPLLFSVKEATCGRGLWTRVGTDIFYYRNSYVSSRHHKYYVKKFSSAAKKNHHEFYYTLSFNIKFKHSLDVCYLAYHYPYTYSYLMSSIWKLGKIFNPRTLLYRCESLCDTLNNNEVPVITITACDNVNNRIEDRQLILLTSRVHPGESNASWLMDGLLSYLTSDALSAAKLRSKYVIKIVPMLNVEGVVNGCHRCGLTNEDLNRRWKSPHPVLHPEIFHTKGLVEFSSRVLKRPPYVFCDFHGHSKMKNFFLYGCSGKESWNEGDRCRVENQVEFRMLSRLLEQCSLSFDPKSCRYKVEKAKESTARVTVWREYGVTRSYTMESTYCGFDQGPLKDTHINIGHLRDMGSSVCTALAALHDETQYMISLIKNSDNVSEDIQRSRFKYMIDSSSISPGDRWGANEEEFSGEEEEQQEVDETN